MAHVTRRVFIELEHLTDGSKVYFARDLDEDGLMAHGATIEDAAASLEEARADRAAHVAKRSDAAPHNACDEEWLRPWAGSVGEEVPVATPSPSRAA